MNSLGYDVFCLEGIVAREKGCAGVNAMTTCSLCQSDQIEVLIDLGLQPVSSHFVASTDAPTVTHPLALALCHACSLVQLSRPFPYRDLTPPFDWITYREPETHLDDVVARLIKFLPTGRGLAAMGTSFKDDTTLERLRQHDVTKAWTINASADLGADRPNAGIESVQGLLTQDKAASLRVERGPVDVLVARHILEHCEAPRQFLAALGEILAPDGLLMLEVPDCSGNLERQDYSMIWEEHASYFTRTTLRRMVAAAGFEILGIEPYQFRFEDVFVVFARKLASGARSEDAVEVAQDIALAQTYGAAFEDWTQRYRRAIDQLMHGSKPVAAYGAGHLTAAFVNFHGLADRFAFIVDDTPQKQGLSLPGTGLPIVPRERLTPGAVSACLFGLSPDVEDKIIANNSAYVSGGGKFYSMFVDSTRSIRSLCQPDRKAVSGDNGIAASLPAG